MKLRVRPALAWVLFGVSVAFAAAALWLMILSPPTANGMPAWLEVLLFSILWLAFPAVGAVVATRRPNNAVGWIFLAIGVSVSLGEFATWYRTYAVSYPADLAWGDVAAWVVAWTYPASVAPIVFLLLLFPDGRPHSPRWRKFAWILGVVGVLHVLALAFTPGPLVFTPEIENPFGAPGIVGRLLAERMRFAVAWQLLWPVAFVAGTASLFFRYRWADLVQRQQLKWFAIAAAVLAAGLALVILSFEQDTETLGNAGLLIPGLVLLTAGVVGVPVASGIAILKHRLFDIDLIIRRSLVYGVLSLLIGGFYVGLAALVGIVVGERFPVGLAVAVTIAATLGFQPARRRLDQLAARLVFGERVSGYELLARFGQTLEHAFDPAELARKLAETVKEGLDLRWVRVSLCFSDGELWRAQPIGAVGVGFDDQVEAEAVMPLAHGDETLGIIECGPKSEGKLLAIDRQLLATLAPQAALAIHNGRLASELAARLDEIRRQAEELAASRARIVQAQDAERRRIEQDIHDGVQQEIVSLAAKLRRVRNQLWRDPELADSTLAELQHETKQTLESIRKLAQGIHPAVLTDKGLVEAIEARAGRLPVGVTIEAAPQLRGARFAPDVEAAGYFFVSEGLANALKHASATHLVVRLLLHDQTLVVEVVDDGVGFVLADVAGLALTGMRDRIESIGGRLRISSYLGVGTRLVAELPARRREPAGV